MTTDTDTSATYTLSIRGREWAVRVSTHRHPGRTVTFVTSTDELDALALEGRPQPPYVTGGDPMVDAEWAAYNALLIKVRTDIAAAAFEAVSGESFTGKWSIHAGCRLCPCSPGFVIRGYTGDWIYVTVLGPAA